MCATRSVECSVVGCSLSGGAPVSGVPLPSGDLLGYRYSLIRCLSVLILGSLDSGVSHSLSLSRTHRSTPMGR
jgi:hypothetical protein